MIENVTTVVAKRACSDSERMNSRSVVDVSTSKVSSTRKFPIQLESLVTRRSVRKFTDYVSIALSDIGLPESAQVPATSGFTFHRFYRPNKKSS